MFQHPVQTMRSFCARSVGVVDGSDEEGDGDDASPCLTSLSLMLSTLPPLPSSWQKEGRILAFLSTNLIDHVNTVDGGGGGGGEHGADAVPTLPAARETWYAAALALHNVLFGQYVYLATEQAETYLKICVLIYHLTYICPSLFDCEVNTFLFIFVNSKL